MSTAPVTQKIESQNKTPQQMAREIVQAAVEDKMVEVHGTTFQKLETVTRYLNRDKISGRSEVWFQKNFDSLTTEALTEIISARHKALVKYLAQKDNGDRREAFVELLARGIPFQDAVKQTGYNPDLDKK